MTLTNARVAVNGHYGEKRDLHIRNEKVWFTVPTSPATTRVDLTGYLVLPGLINAHDHLEFSLYPRLGRGPYPNATDWAHDIFHPDRSPVKDQLRIPKTSRLLWGGLKNLLSGVTTVAHHNNYDQTFAKSSFPVRVVRKYSWAHSLEFCNSWRETFQNTAANVPFIIHAGEGTDDRARCELDTLTESGVLRSNTVLVHAVAFDDQIRKIEASGASVVWCPSSNHFTLRRTLGPHVFGSRIPIALATDSSLTGLGDLLDEISVAAQIITPERLYQMVTSDAAAILKLPPGFGAIRNGGPADLLILRDLGLSPAQSLLAARPEAVLVKGELRLATPAFLSSRRWPGAEALQQVELENRGNYSVKFDVQTLLADTKNALAAPVHLAGKAIAA